MRVASNAPTFYDLSELHGVGDDDLGLRACSPSVTYLLTFLSNPWVLSVRRRRQTLRQPDDESSLVGTCRSDESTVYKLFSLSLLFSFLYSSRLEFFVTIRTLELANAIARHADVDRAEQEEGGEKP